MKLHEVEIAENTFGDRHTMKIICEFVIAVGVVLIVIFIMGFIFHLIEYLGNPKDEEDE